MTARLLDNLLDLSVAPGYTKVGYRLRGTFQWIHIDHPEAELTGTR